MPSRLKKNSSGRLMFLFSTSGLWNLREFSISWGDFFCSSHREAKCENDDDSQNFAEKTLIKNRLNEWGIQSDTSYKIIHRPKRQVIFMV